MVDAEANEGGQECSDSALYSAEHSRRLLLSLACLQSACSTGVLFGFSGMACDAFSPGGVGARATARIYHAHTALAAALLEKGEYSELCAGAEAEAQLAADGACTAQTLRFSLIYTFASTCLFSAFLVFGLIVDRFGGPLRANLAGTSLVALGLLVLSQSDSKTLDLFPLGFALIGDAALCPSLQRCGGVFQTAGLKLLSLMMQVLAAQESISRSFMWLYCSRRKGLCVHLTSAKCDHSVALARLLSRPLPRFLPVFSRVVCTNPQEEHDTECHSWSLCVERYRVSCPTLANTRSRAVARCLPRSTWGTSPCPLALPLSPALPSPNTCLSQARSEQVRMCKRGHAHEHARIHTLTHIQVILCCLGVVGMRIWPETKFKPGDAIRFHRNRLLCYVVVSKASLAAADAAAAGSQGVASHRVASDPVASGGATCQGMPMNVSTGVEGTGKSQLLVEEQGVQRLQGRGAAKRGDRSPQGDNLGGSRTGPELKGFSETPGANSVEETPEERLEAVSSESCAKAGHAAVAVVRANGEGGGAVESELRHLHGLPLKSQLLTVGAHYLCCAHLYVSPMSFCMYGS